jgi:hypothetical protein
MIHYKEFISLIASITARYTEKCICLKCILYVSLQHPFVTFLRSDVCSACCAREGHRNEYTFSTKCPLLFDFNQRNTPQLKTSRKWSYYMRIVRNGEGNCCIFATFLSELADQATGWI